jgi:CubicO group peptidase (beta-lactamase class C family)
MGDVRIKLHVWFANGHDAAGLDVRVDEVGGSSYQVGKTGDDGKIDAFVRGRRRRHAFGRTFEDPFDHPTLNLHLSDQAGHAINTPDVQTFILPPWFDPPPLAQSPTDPVLTPGTPSALADAAIRPIVEPNAPGYIVFVRKDGSEWANATRGLSRAPLPGISALAMTNDTIINLASMSKPITATALVAMIDDWTAMRDALAAIGTPGAPTRHIQVAHWRFLSKALVDVDVPQVLAPLFANKQRAFEFLSLLPASVSSAVRDALALFANDFTTFVSIAPAVPAGYFGLLRRVLQGMAVPPYHSPFLPLIQSRLRAGTTAGLGIDTITIHDLLTHQTMFLRNDPSDLDPTQHTPAEMAAVAHSEPAGGVATFDLWGFLSLLLRENGGESGRQYHNNNYTLLSAVIEACTETTFDDYVTRRLFSDPRFNNIRRRVVDPNRAAFYYQGTSPNWTGGTRYPDYSNWSGNGGFYATANQLTDWMHALYTGESLVNASGSAPLISPAGRTNLFSVTAYFSGGVATRTDGPPAANIRFQHNGSTSVGGGSVCGNLAIIDSPSHTIYTAFFAANGNLDADPPFRAAVVSLPWT